MQSTSGWYRKFSTIASCFSLAFFTFSIWLSPVLAETSANFQIDNNQVGPNQFRHSSGNFMIDGSVEPIVGLSESNNFENEAGSPTLINEDEVTPEEPDPRPSSGFAGTISLSNANCTVAYKNLIPLSGSKTPNVIYMFLNGGMSGFYFPDQRSWQKTAWLQEGANELRIWGENENNLKTRTITAVFNKVRMGDINQDGVTDDYDLSLLANKWNVRGDCATDLNRDSITDDYDLSLLATYWSY